jgi:hypothetical protein
MAHVCALEISHECADQVVPVVDLAGQQVLEPRPRRVGVVQGEVAMMTSSLVAPPIWHARR